MYLAFSFVNCTSESIETRMMISIILKENVIRYWKLMPPEVQQYIMSIVPNLISDPDLHLRELCGALICAILAQTHISGWPNIVFDLIGALDSDNANLVLGAFGTISKLFEDHGRELCQPLPDFPQQPTEILVPKLLQMMSPEHEDLLNLSLQIFIHMIPWKPAALLVHINDFFQVRFKVYSCLLFGRESVQRSLHYLLSY